LKFKRAENQDRVIDVKNKNDEQEQVVNAPAGGNTIFAFKNEQSKILEFFSKKRKDTMLSNGFHQVCGRSHQNKQLDNDAAYNHSANALRGQAWR
jgi:hypothetical protein